MGLERPINHVDEPLLAPARDDIKWYLDDSIDKSLRDHSKQELERYLESMTKAAQKHYAKLYDLDRAIEELEGILNK